MIYLIDSNSIIYTLYYRSKSGLPENTHFSSIVSCAMSMILRELHRILSVHVNRSEPVYLIPCFDSGKKSFRVDINPEYKANRKKEKDEGILEILNALEDTFNELNLVPFKQDHIEGDDLVASFAYQYTEKYPKGESLAIWSRDKDLLQCLAYSPEVYYLRYNPKADEISYLNRYYVEQTFGVKAYQLLDYLSLVGDVSDNIKGCPGIGPKKALKLIHKYKNIDNIINHAKISSASKDLSKVKENIDTLLQSRQLVSLLSSVPISLDLKPYRISGKSLSKIKSQYESWYTI